MPEIGLHTNVHTPQTGSVREGGGAAGNGNVQTAPADAEALAMPSQARERARQNMPPLDRHLAGVADPGREGLMKKVGRWFREGFIRTRAGLPETVNVNMPGGGTVNRRGNTGWYFGWRCKRHPIARRYAAVARYRNDGRCLYKTYSAQHDNSYAQKSDFFYRCRRSNCGIYSRIAGRARNGVSKPYARTVRLSRNSCSTARSAAN